MRVILIGGSGFIGSHLVDILLENDQQVIVFDRHPEKFRSPIAKVKYIEGEMGNRKALEEAIAEGIDQVVLLASATVPKTSNEDPTFDVQANLLETLAVLDISVKYKIKKVLYFSSGGTVYGIPKSIPIKEDHSTYPMCSYGIVKLATEKYLSLYHHLYGLPYAALRLSNPYGVRQDPDSIQGIIPIFISLVLRNKPLTIWGDGSTVRDYVHIRDVAQLSLAALNSSESGVFNVGSGVGLSVNELIDRISTTLSVSPVVQIKPGRAFDVPSVVLDCSEAQRRFQWKPQCDLNRGIAEIADWLQINVLSKPVKK